MEILKKIDAVLRYCVEFGTLDAANPFLIDYGWEILDPEYNTDFEKIASKIGDSLQNQYSAIFINYYPEFKEWLAYSWYVNSLSNSIVDQSKILKKFLDGFKQRLPIPLSIDQYDEMVMYYLKIIFENLAPMQRDIIQRLLFAMLITDRRPFSCICSMHKIHQQYSALFNDFNPEEDSILDCVNFLYIQYLRGLFFTRASPEINHIIDVLRSDEESFQVISTNFELGNDIVISFRFDHETTHRIIDALSNPFKNFEQQIECCLRRILKENLSKFLEYIMSKPIETKRLARNLDLARW